MKWYCVFACLVMLIRIIHGGRASDNLCRKSYLNERKLNVLKKELIKVKKSIIQLNEKGTCTNGLADVTKQLRDITDKIEDLNKIDIDVSSGSTRSSVVKIKVSRGYKTCMKGLKNTPITKENAKIWCLRSAIWNFSTNEPENDDVEIIQAPPEENIGDEHTSDRPHVAPSIIRNGGAIVAPANITTPPSGKRIRREYRTLSLEERQRYHDAVNVLYQNGTITTMARIHRRALRRKGAHGGPAFLPWHRVFLALYEEALREVDSSVSLPYWDSSLDQNMVSPALSVMWDKEHLGTGTGVVTEGPFANWIAVKSPLQRKIADGGSLIQQTRIDNVMSFCLRVDFDRRWELAHNSVHRWVGGTMARALSPGDPVFYMHHAFIDYQWEKFREHQLIDCVNVNPATDYPLTDDEHHKSDAEMDGMRFLKNIDGIADYWTKNWYNYEDTPTCNTGCNEYPDLFCENGRCVSKTRDVLSFNRKKRHVVRNSGSRVRFDIHIKTSTNGSICVRNPYQYTCPRYRLPPTSEADYSEALLLDEVQRPPSIDRLEVAIDAEFYKEFIHPPVIGPIVFKAAEDQSRDCRSLETGAYDLVSAGVKGKKISKEGFFRASLANPYKTRE